MFACQCGSFWVLEKCLLASVRVFWVLEKCLLASVEVFGFLRNVCLPVWEFLGS